MTHTVSMTPTRMGGGVKAVVTIACILLLLVSLLDMNVVTAAAPSIGRYFGAAATAHIPWLVSAYALAETVAQPLYGKLTDRLGVRPILLASIVLFGVGSVLCGFAPSMTALIFFRLLQGLGAAGLHSTTFVLLGHLRTATGTDDDGAGNSAGGVLLAVGIVAGPLLGGTIIAHMDWRWIFWINVPILAVILLVLLIFLRLSIEQRTEPIDWPAAGALAGAAVALQLVCVLGGQEFAWWSPQTVIIGLGGIACVVYFGLRQRRSRAPFFPPEVLRLRILRQVAVLQLTAGIGLAASVYITFELQLVRGFTPFQAGLHLIAMAAGVILGAIAGFVLIKRGRPLKASLIIGTAASALALAALIFCGPAAPLPVVWLLLAVNGFGSGISLGNELTIIQDSVDARDLGIATTGIRFVETLGTSAGATLFGLVFAHIAGTGTDAVALAIGVIFAIAALFLLAAALTATRLPRRMTRTASAVPLEG